jgi:hypothetical protein
VSPDHPTRARLTDAGLGYWGRRVRRRDNGDRLYLASLVIEGGLPQLALAGSGWLGGYLARVIADLERGHQPDAEAASRHADFHLPRVPTTFQDPCLAELMGETALAVTCLRREASERPAGVDPVLWLDTVKADWRAGFPIQIEDAAVARLIEGLVREAIAPAPEMQLIERVARVRNGRIELGVTFGETARADALLRPLRRELGAALLARLVPEGRFADALDRVPAVLERLSSGDDAAWQVRCTLPPDRRTAWGVDFATEACVSVTYDQRVLGSWVLPGGEAADTGIAVFALADEARTDALGVLRLIATGAARTRARQVAVLAPASWACSPETDARVECLATEESRQLVKLQGTAVFHAPDGLRHRVVTGTDKDGAARYFVAGERLDDLEAAHPILAGIPEIWQSLDEGATSPVRSSRIHVRQAHPACGWMALDADRLPFGLLQARIEDGVDNVSLLRFARVPAGARIEQVPGGNGRSTIVFSGFEAATLEVRKPIVGTVELRSDAAADRQEVIVEADTAVDASRLSIELRWPDGGSLQADMLVLLRRVGIYRANGTPYQDRAPLTIADLRGGFAAASERAELIAELVEPGRPSVIHLRWSIPGRLGMSLLAPEIEGLLAMSDDLDAYVKLSCVAGGIQALRVDVHRFDHALEPLPHGVRLSVAPARADSGCSQIIEVVGKPITQVNAEELRLGVLDACDPASLRTIVGVPYGEGSWLVYVRRAGRLRSRPVLVARPQVAHNGTPSVLQGLMAIPDRQQREHALGEALERAATATDSELPDEIAGLVRSVSGDLPPQTLDPIRMLADHPAMALRILARAAEKDVGALLALAGELPLSWQWLRLDHWCQAFEAEWKALHIELSQRGLSQFADDAIQGRLQAIARQEPRLAPQAAIVWRAMGFVSDNRLQGALDQSLGDLQVPAGTLKAVAEQMSRAAAEECFKRNDGRQWPGRPSFREEGTYALPAFVGRYSGFVHSVLDAPHVAAQVAAGQRPWSQRIERLLRMNRAFDPSYFDDVLAMQIVVAWRSMTAACC